MFKKLVIFIALVFFFSSNCYAVHPILSHHAKTRGQHKWKIDVNYSLEYEKSYKSGNRTVTNAVHPVFTYGVLDTLDFIVDAPVEYKEHSGKKDYGGIDDMMLASQWTCVKNERFNIALYPKVKLSTGNYSSGDGEGLVTFGGMVLLSAECAPITCHLRGDYMYNQNKKHDRFNIWKVYFTPEVKLTDKFDLLTICGLERDTDMHNPRIPLFLGGGVRYHINEHFSVVPSAKVGLRKIETDVFLMVGTTYEY